MRETKKFKTKGGYEIEIKTYLTYGEAREIQRVYLDGVNVSISNDGQTKIPDLSASSTIDAQNKAIELIVVSVNGEKENVVKLFMDLPKNDGDEAMVEIDKVQASLTEEKKTK